MATGVIFHRLVQRDMDGILQYYRGEAGESLASRFYEAFMAVVEQAAEEPERFHYLKQPIRRASIPKFPYHFLYRRIPSGIRVLVLRHDKRRPAFGLSRK
jgi:plasmid stabilization system protein ParE